MNEALSLMALVVAFRNAKSTDKRLKPRRRIRREIRALEKIGVGGKQRCHRCKSSPSLEAHVVVPLVLHHLAIFADAELRAREALPELRRDGVGVFEGG